jgi:hypothetical protein
MTSAGCLNYPCRTPAVDRARCRRMAVAIMPPVRLRLQTTAHTPARVLRGRISSGVAVLLASRNSCLQNRHAAKSIMSMHSRPAWRHARCAGPHRLVVAGRTEHVHIVEAMPAISRRSTFHPQRTHGVQPTAVPTEIQR